MKYRLFFIVIFFSLFFIKPFSCHALSGLNLIISPLPINLSAQPGSTVSAQMKIKNGGVDIETIHVGLMKFAAFGEDGMPRLIDREAGDNYFDWMTFSNNDFTLIPGEWKTITATINIPSNAAFGYYYAVTFGRKDEGITDTRVSKIEGAVSILILLDVKVPNAVSDIEVLEFTSDRKVYEFLPTKFFIKLKNKGNVHVAPRGNIFIDFGKKSDISILEINDVKGNILPNSNRIFETTWSDGFPIYVDRIQDDKVVTDKRGNNIKDLKWDFSKLSKLRFGKFTANMLLVYDDGTKDIPIEAKVSFWVIPWRILGVSLLFLTLVTAGVWSIISLIIKKVSKK